jgi:hypothetical protein
MRDGSGLGWFSPHAIVGILCAVAIGVGWASRDNLNLSASDGLGYALGIVGLLMMVLLLGYSIRKRARFLRNSGAMRSWFEVHLMLGLLGPTIILYHANFGLGSANATISLVCVLAVSGSGVGGRFLYGRMHRSLAGSQRSVGGMVKIAHESLGSIESILERAPDARRALAKFDAFAVDGAAGLLRSFRALVLLPLSARARSLALRSIRRSEASPSDVESARRAIAEHLREIRRASHLRLFEQLFALWHAIHIPLTIILFVSAAIHIVAVHLY